MTPFACPLSRAPPSVVLPGQDPPSMTRLGPPPVPRGATVPPRRRCPWAARTSSLCSDLQEEVGTDGVRLGGWLGGVGEEGEGERERILAPATSPRFASRREATHFCVLVHSARKMGALYAASVEARFFQLKHYGGHILCLCRHLPTLLETV